MHTTPLIQTPTQSITIDLAERSYPIVVGSGLLGQSSSYAPLQRLGSLERRTALVVTNETVAPLYAAQLQAALQPLFARVLLCVLPDGEAHKNWATLNQIFDTLLQNACDRRTVLFALGGGVVGDMTGFAAASFMRGVPFVQVPTTLLAQVDSSVGGKAAINHPLGKNMIGAFYQPQLVLCDLATLATLPPREYSAGLAEVIKYAPLGIETVAEGSEPIFKKAPGNFLAWLHRNMALLMQRDPAALAYAVKRSCELKAAVVSADEREAGQRALLNLGHTFGHAIEAGMGYGVWLHGEAVAAGMVLAARLSVRLGLIDSAYAQSLQQLIALAGLPTAAPSLADLPAQRFLDLMRLDKKAKNGQIEYVLLRTHASAPSGVAAFTHFVDDATVLELLSQ